MTDTTNPTQTNPSIPQRARRNAQEPAATQAAASGTSDAPREIGEAPLFDDMRSDEAIALDDHIEEPDRYAELEDKRAGNFVREPFGEPRLKLQAPARPGYRRYWFNDDVPGRIKRALDAGYSFVKVAGRNVRNVVGRAKNGGAQIAYLMEIPQAWYEEDMARQQAKVDAIDAAIKGGTITKDGDAGDNRYIPREGIRYINPRETTVRHIADGDPAPKS